MEEKKEQDVKVHACCRPGLAALKALVKPTGEMEDLCDSWPSSSIHFDGEGYVTHLNLGNQRLRKGLDNIEAIFSFPRLSSLNLGGTDLPLPQVQSVLNCVSNSIESLYLGGNGYRNEICKILAKCMPRKLQKLDLRYNDIDSEGLSILCKNMTSVKFLYLEGNRIETLEGLCHSLKQNDSCMKELYLGSNRIGPAGAQQLSESLGGLTKIYLESNQIGPEGAAALAAVLEKQQNTSVAHLFVDNNNIGKPGSQRLAKALSSGSTIGESMFDG